MNKRRFGLVGFPLSHSFSKKYFTEKFEALGLTNTHRYDLFEMEDISSLKQILEETEGLTGMNVTIPHKLNVLPYLSEIDAAAERIGAVNVLKVLEGKKLRGYNSDYYGFKRSLEEFLGDAKDIQALVLGNGGAARAVTVALEDLEIPFRLVSRTPHNGSISYKDATDLIPVYRLIINCSPLGTYPNVDTCPEINYKALTDSHFLYDLVYNPEETLFLRNGKSLGAKTLNGYNMLVYQAEKSWEIWNK